MRVGDHSQPFDARAELRQQQSREEAEREDTGAEPHGWTPDHSRRPRYKGPRQPTVVPQPLQALEDMMQMLLATQLGWAPIYGACKRT